MEAVRCTESVTLVYKTTRRHIPEDCNHTLLDFYLNENAGISLAQLEVGARINKISLFLYNNLVADVHVYLSVTLV
jgi:hypothetical protein